MRLASSFCIAVSAFIAMGGAAAAETQATPPSQQRRDAVEAKLSLYFVLPGTSLWRFAPIKPYVGGEVLMCGLVNYESAMRKYVGYKRFYAVLEGDRVTLAQLEDKFLDVSGRLGEKLDLICGKGGLGK